jgi:L-alanine-DL-glutamate epimerase-like enolase superfamily enzyme
MRIHGCTLLIFRETEDHHQEVPEYRLRKVRQNGVAILHTDAGIDGVVSTDASRLRHLARVWPQISDHLVGQEVFDRERIEKRLVRQFWVPGDIVGIIDYALWDIAGKALNLPIYKLLGGARDRVLGYASTVHHNSDDRFIDTVRECCALGFKAIKIHPYCVPEDDMRLVRKIRAAVGDEMILMLDTLVYPGMYNLRQAKRMAELLDELDFRWFEDPLHRTDLQGLAELRRSCRKVQIRVADSTPDIRDYAAIVRMGCADILAGPPSFGITDLMKLAHFAEVNGLAMEPHDFGGGTASLHVLLAITNGEFYEIATPRGCFDTAVYPGVYLDPCWIDAEGYVRAPTKPGLGFEIDLRAAKAVTVEQISL